jgi:hypothetical protein
MDRYCRLICTTKINGPISQVSSALLHYREALKVMTRETQPLAHARINTLIGAAYASVASMPVKTKWLKLTFLFQKKYGKDAIFVPESLTFTS